VDQEPHFIQVSRAHVASLPSGQFIFQCFPSFKASGFGSLFFQYHHDPKSTEQYQHKYTSTPSTTNPHHGRTKSQPLYHLKAHPRPPTKARSHLPRRPPHTTRTIDSIVVGLSYAGIGYLVYSNMRKTSPWELAGVGLGSLTFSYGLFDLRKRNGMIKGASFALRKADERDTKG